MIYMYFAGPASKASLPGWAFGPPGYAYKLQLAGPEEVEMAKDAGWRETLTEAIEAYEGVLREPALGLLDPSKCQLPVGDANPGVTIDETLAKAAEIVKRGPGRPRKEQP